ncbi:MAG: hypothetical protein ACK5MV_12795 [Aminipila sp.]
MRFKDKKLILLNSGSYGCGYTGFTYENGEYLTLMYDDYSPEFATLNGKLICGEEFKKQFNLVKVPDEHLATYQEGWDNSYKARIRIEPESKDTLIIEDEKIMIDG